MGAQQQTRPATTPPASGSDPQFKVRLDFNRWHDVAELKSDFEKLAKAWPKMLKLSSLGKSHGGRDIILMTINNPDTGPEMSKPAMYIEANVHGNEIQGAEVSLYTIWYLMENYGRIDQITKLVNERVFYVVPTVNPDGRDYFLKGTGAGSRTGHVPVDDDNDGVSDEDGDDDLNGNGVIEQILKRVPGQGNLRRNAQDPRQLEQVPPGQTGDYILLGSEGIDNDGDGRVNEDPVGGYDGNRNWASNWQPEYIQGGAMDYPFQLPEAKAINDFLMTHPNIAGVQSYHNNGGMILRGPGAEWQGEYPAADVNVYDELGTQGERMLPVLPVSRDLERPLHRSRRIHRLDQRRPRHAVVLERALERRPVLQQPGARRAAAAAEQPDRRPARSGTTSTTSSSSATSTSSGKSSTIRSSARSKWAAGRRRRAGCRRAS